MKIDFERLRDQMLEQFEDEQEIFNKKLAQQRTLINTKLDKEHFEAEIEELSRMIAEMAAGASGSPE